EAEGRGAADPARGVRGPRPPREGQGRLELPGGPGRRRPRLRQHRDAGPGPRRRQPAEVHAVLGGHRAVQRPQPQAGPRPDPEGGRTGERGNMSGMTYDEKVAGFKARIDAGEKIEAGDWMADGDRAGAL